MPDPILTQAQEDTCLARSEARRLGSDKILAAEHKVSVATVRRAIARAKSRKEKNK